MSNPDGSIEGLWTVQDVARYLQASRSWVYLKAEAGILPCLRIEGLLRFHPEAIRAFARGEGTAKGGAVVPFRNSGRAP